MAYFGLLLTNHASRSESSINSRSNLESRHRFINNILEPDGILGWDKVQDLAEYLVYLRQALYLDEQQVTEVIHLWTALPDGDKRRINYQSRHQPKLAHSRVKAPKNTRVTPGVESVKRSLIGPPGVRLSGPAQVA
ncbi:hypothetical protein AMECASPLE_018805 [Ameca splendens]|uniref:Uncharacterized protein n=1 Tax=Ameca splendens TaxID=208324 RepID=A0ABV0Y309_9TELE